MRHLKAMMCRFIHTMTLQQKLFDHHEAGYAVLS